MRRFVCDNISESEEGHLLFAGQDTLKLAAEYGTPLYLMDEARVRHNCRVYRENVERHFRPGSRVLYASKANSFRQIYRIVAEEGLGTDVVSSGEICTAASAGFPMANAYFHSNNKTDADIAYAMEKGVGQFVVDSPDELAVIEREAEKRGVTKKVLLRLTPGIDPHTYAAVNTGTVDSKFGTAIETGQAEEFVKYAMTLKHVALEGFHCHVGSQVFAEDVFERASVVMLEFIADMRGKYGCAIPYLDMGGGIGVRYVEGEPELDIGQKIASLAGTIHATCERLKISEPMILLEPGRSIVADAGMTIYTVGSVKTIPGYKRYVSVDGGMTDNPRYALYKSRYTCLAAGKLREKENMPCSLVGRCCESGDIIQEHVSLPQNICRGDIVAVCTTGAYNYSMASNYNRVGRPPIVMLKDGGSYVAVRRETPEDIVRLDV